MLSPYYIRFTGWGSKLASKTGYEVRYDNGILQVNTIGIALSWNEIFLCSVGFCFCIL